VEIELSGRQIEALLCGLDNLLAGMIQQGDCIGHHIDSETEIFAQEMEYLKQRLLEGLPAERARSWPASGYRLALAREGRAPETEPGWPGQPPDPYFGMACAKEATR
jgi:hypothetical protein